MDRTATLEKLKFLYDQVHQTAERIEHLPSSLPLDVRPRSLNYGQDLKRLESEYNHLVQVAREQGLLKPADLDAEGLPHHFDGHV